MTHKQHTKPLTHCEKYGHSWSRSTVDGWKKCIRTGCQAALAPTHLQLHTPFSTASTAKATPPTVEQVSLF
jgi:hypothetical protein